MRKTFFNSSHRRKPFYPLITKNTFLLSELQTLPIVTSFSSQSLQLWVPWTTLPQSVRPKIKNFDLRILFIQDFNAY